MEHKLKPIILLDKMENSKSIVNTIVIVTQGSDCIFSFLNGMFSSFPHTMFWSRSGASHQILGPGYKDSQRAPHEC